MYSLKNSVKSYLRIYSTIFLHMDIPYIMLRPSITLPVCREMGSYTLLYTTHVRTECHRRPYTTPGLRIPLGSLIVF